MTFLYDLSADLVRQILGYNELDVSVLPLWMTLSRPMQLLLERSVQTVALTQRGTTVKYPFFLGSFRSLKRLVFHNFLSPLSKQTVADCIQALPPSLEELELATFDAGDLLDIYSATNPYIKDEPLFDEKWFEDKHHDFYPRRTDIASALPSLKSLVLSSSKSITRNFEPHKFPSSLTHFSFDIPYGNTWGVPILKTLPQQLLRLEARGADFTKEFCRGLPRNLTELICPASNLSSDIVAELPRSLTSFPGTFSFDIETIRAVPPLLTELYLWGADCPEEGICATIPRNVKSLSIDGGTSYYVFTAEDLRALPRGIVDLACRLNLSQLEPSDFPPTLTSLQTQFYDEISASDVKRLPPSLQTLAIGLDTELDAEGLYNLPEGMEEWFKPNVNAFYTYY